MIAKLTTGNGFGGSLRYDLRQGEEDLYSGLAKVLAVSGVSEDYDDDGNLVIDVRKVGLDFRQQTMGYTGEGVIRKPVYHWVLSYSPKDNVSEEQMQTDAKEFLKRIGFGDTQYVITVHYDKEHHHLHIVTNIVNNQGKRIPTRGLIDKAHEAAAAITRSRGYTWGEKATKETIDKAHKPHEKVRYMIEPMIRETLSRSTSLTEFKDRLRVDYGITCNYTLATDGKRGRMSFGYEHEGQLHTFSASSVDRGLSFGKIKEALDSNSKRQVAERNDALQAQIYRNTWYTSLAPQYTKMVTICSQLYTRHRSIWDTVVSDNKVLSERFARIRDLKAHADLLQNDIRRARGSSAVLTAVSVAIGFINPVAAVALKVIGQIVINANKENDIALRRAAREEMAELFEEISSIKQHQETLRAEDREVMQKYRECKADKDAFRDAYAAVRTHQAVPVLAEKFEHISRFFPAARDIQEGQVVKSNAGYDLFFVEVDGQLRLAADLGGKVVASKEPVPDPFNLSTMHWVDDAGREYTFADGRLRARVSRSDLVEALGGGPVINLNVTSPAKKAKALSSEECEYISKALRSRTMQEARLALGLRGINIFTVERDGGVDDIQIVKEGEAYYAKDSFQTSIISESLENFARLSGTRTTASIEREKKLKAQMEAQQKAQQEARRREAEERMAQPRTQRRVNTIKIKGTGIC